MYPLYDPETGKVTDSDNIVLHPRMMELYKFFKFNSKLRDIKNYNPEYMSIFSREVLQKIKDREEGWENYLPEGIPELIKEKGLFKTNEILVD